MVPAHRSVPRQCRSVVVVEVGAKHLRRVQSVLAASPRTASAAVRSHIVGVVERSEAHDTYFVLEGSTHKTLRVAVLGAVCKVGIGKHTTVHTLLQTEVEHRLFVAVVNARNLCKVALLVVSLNLVDNACRQILHGSLGVAHHKLLAVHLNLLNLLAVDRNLAVVVNLCAGQTLHQLLNGRAFGCAERRGVIHKCILLKHNLCSLRCNGSAFEGNG